MRTATPFNSRVSPGMFCAQVFALLAFLAAALCGALVLTAQAPATAALSTAHHKPATAAHKPAHKHKRPVAAQAQSPMPQPAAPVTPPVPQLPLWPANQKPTPASVTWDSHGLRIDAANSSLAQILEDVSTATGAKVEGFDTDQRIFGVYGPGPARDVLSQLLHGTGYNVLLAGDTGQGTPRKIVLSSSRAGYTAATVNAAPANTSDEDADTDEQPQPSTPPTRPSFAPGGPARVPQQMQEPPRPNNPPN